MFYDEIYLGVILTRIISKSGKECDKGEKGNQTVAVYAYILIWVIFNGLLKMKE